MKKFNKQIVGLMTFTFIALAASIVYQNKVEACSESTNNQAYVIEKDPRGRLIVLWADLDWSNLGRGKPLQIAIDNNSPKTISLPGQSCSAPKMDFTDAGDIVVIWTAIDKDRATYALYITMLPYGGNWTQPLCLNKNELLTPKSHKLIVSSENEVNVFWESMSFFPSALDSNVTHVKKELRNASGSISSFSDSPKTITRLEVTGI